MSRHFAAGRSLETSRALIDGVMGRTCHMTDTCLKIKNMP
jgi:hypothetical protein